MLSNTALGVSVGACTFLFKSERGTVSVQFVSHTRPCNRHDNGLHGRSARLRVHSRRQNMVRGERLRARHLRPTFLGASDKRMGGSRRRSRLLPTFGHDLEETSRLCKGDRLTLHVCNVAVASSKIDLAAVATFKR